MTLATDLWNALDGTTIPSNTLRTYIMELGPIFRLLEEKDPLRNKGDGLTPLQVRLIGGCLGTPLRTIELTSASSLKERRYVKSFTQQLMKEDSVASLIDAHVKRYTAPIPVEARDFCQTMADQFEANVSDLYPQLTTVLLHGSPMVKHAKYAFYDLAEYYFRYRPQKKKQAEQLLEMLQLHMRSLFMGLHRQDRTILLAIAD